MYRFCFLSCFFIYSCSHGKYLSNEEDSKLISELIGKFIVRDSLNQSGTINNNLLAYEYYEQENIEDGYAVPPPYYTSSKNEFDFINSVELNTFFHDSASIAHIKHQLLNSKKIAKKYKLSTLDIVKLGVKNRDPNSWYSFFLPIFNADSSAVYLQYDFYANGLGGYGEGNGAIFLKKNGEWEYQDFIPGWIR
ncbi:hypothetical protein [Algoriphagus resistens]|uniref:hypothetical protein n=1 Tax=Algoriphagus resistens TaxID=1750590 RepID=UPI000716B279|nr:hypothetical protein [Algoriphagus resistens]